MDAPLLAKSKSRPQIDMEITLTGHTKCVLWATDALFGGKDSPKPLAKSWLRFFGLAVEDFPRFRHHLRVAAAAHDWGKANDGFQNMVEKTGEQVVRHEHLSGLLLADLLVDASTIAWLRDNGIDEQVVLAAVIGHHVKAGKEGDYALGALTGKRESLTFLRDHADFEAIWRMVQDEVGVPCPSPFAFPGRWRDKDDIQPKRKGLCIRLDREKSRLRQDDQGRRWVAAVRAGLIAADAVGSAVVRIESDDNEKAEERIKRWVGRCFATTLTGKDVWEKVVKLRIKDLRDRKRWDDAKGFTFGDETGFNQFQRDVPAQGPRVLLTAPCGSGKTLAAWNWIKARLDEQSASRVLFLYPTRATATEGFRDYVSWAPEDEAGLLSGTANYEFEDMFKTPDDPGDPRKGLKYQSEERLFALGHWKKRIFSATADQFFPFMQYAYGPLCLLPLLADSIVVVDEVHSFDKSMFSTLKRFLKEFPSVPVLCMTATLPATRREALIAECKLKPYPETPPADLLDDSTYPRYHVEWIDREGARSLALGELESRRRLLWVSNRVADCQATFKALGGEEDRSYDHNAFKAHCYHSRFKLEDRKARHKDLIHDFQESARAGASSQGILGATTQVCEMSLDLDAEVLVTELAPIASLIQRMGRCNRDSEKMRRRPIGRVYVLRPEPGKEKPYERPELDAAERFVNAIVGRGISQDKLEEAYREFDKSEIEPDRLCPFLDSGPYALAREESFRDIDEFTVPCVLDYDLTRVGEILQQRNPADRVIDGFIVPVPRRFATLKKPEGSWFPKWLSVASGVAYNPRTGFDETKLPPPGDSKS
jgi:CRISPR-associated endonuclease/helicase Cas3